MADNAVTLAKMAGLARGKIIIGDSSGDPSALAAGANGKMLVADANGDITWTTVSGDATLSAGALTLGSIEASHVTEISNLTAVEGAQLENIGSVTISNTQWGYVGALDQGLTSTSDVAFGDATLANITVTGTASFHATKNLQVTDAFVLMRSGSSDTGDGGIVVQQATQDSGDTLAFDGSAARWGVTSSFSADASAVVPAAYLSLVVDVDASHADNAEYKKNGNIKVNSGDIYIYS